MKRSHESKLRRAIERELITGLRPRRRRALLERLRGNASARRRWDRAVAAFRVLEDRSVSRFELDQVERWLLDDLPEARPATRSSRLGLWAALGTLFATVGAVLLLVWPQFDEFDQLGGQAPGELAEFTARGRRAWQRPLALEPVCGQPTRAAHRRGCELDELLGFALRLDPGLLASDAAGAPLQLTLFGLSERGELYYYAPNPDDAALPRLDTVERWTPVPLSIRLQVNHRPGRVRVFALASPEPATTAEVEGWAALLTTRPAATPDSPPWHLSLPPAQLEQVCPTPKLCASAESEFEITVDPSPSTSGDTP